MMNLRNFIKPKRWGCALCVLTSPLAAQSSFEAGPGIEDAPFKREIALTCQMDLECYEGEACAQTAFGFDMNGLAGGLTAKAMAALVTMSSDTGDTDLLGTVSGTVMVLSGGGVDARYMLTLSEASARLSVHYSGGPVMISYIGSCQ